MNETIRIGTRKSLLALKQAQLIADKLKECHPELEIQLVTRDTLGDRILEKPLQDFGGKGVFVSEFELALKEGKIDLAVHSAKDMPMELEDGLTIAAVSPREDPRDVFVTCRGRKPEEKGIFRIGTSSPRRQLQAKENWDRIWQLLCGRKEQEDSLRPVPVCGILRGNVHTRLQRLEEGKFDGIILAAAGLKRLGISEGEKYNFCFLDTDICIPAGGQGIMAVEAVEGSRVCGLCGKIDQAEVRMCLELERSVLCRLGAGCHEPIGIFSEIHAGMMEVWGISRRQDRVRRIHLTGGTSLEERETLAENAWKGLVG